MTDPPTHHLDDEQLSAALDGEAVPAHLEACSLCRARRVSLDGARRAVRSTVPTLAPDIIDAVIAAAVASAGTPMQSPAATTSPIDRRPNVAPGPRRPLSRLTSPPPAWLAAAAVIAVLVGLAGVVLSTRGDDSRSSVAVSANDSATTDGDERAAAGVEAGAAADPELVTADPELVTADLGDQDDPTALTTLLAATPRTLGNLDAAQAEPAVRDRVSSSAGAPAPGGEVEAEDVADRAQCRDQATRIGAGRLGALVSTSRLRWAGQPAEVLVFTLTEPAGGVSRQALVMARPGCGLLVDPRF